MTLLNLLFLSTAVLASPFGPEAHGWGHSGWGWHPYGGGMAKAAYFLDNDPSGSCIVSLRINKDKSLSDPVRTSTGGIGLIGTNATGFPNTADGLFSQGAVTVSGNLLFTVNPGSNTLSMFRINPTDPYHPQLVGKPMDTMGEVPMSVAYSEKLAMACVLNGGVKAGVSCFHVDQYRGLEVEGSFRPLGKRIISETTPPNGPPGTSSQIIFDPASKAVFALVKGNAGAMPVKLGSIVAYAVHDGSISTEPIVTQIKDIPMEFGSVFLSETRMLLSDPSYGASILEMTPELKFKELVHTPIAGQSAICWSEYSPALNTAYVNDAGRNLINKMNVQTGSWEGSIPITTDGNPMHDGVFDSVIDTTNNMMYALTGANGVVAVDLKSGKQTQFLDLSSFGNRQGYQGMAMYA